uniref:Tubulin-specific chaperone A n=1 Tax=Panagrellus redivivus TaxID=6233 RepID=A0A7E4UNP8_PANRE
MTTPAEKKFHREQVAYLDEHMCMMSGRIRTVRFQRCPKYYTVSDVKNRPDDLLQDLHDLREWVSHLGADITTLKDLYRALEPKHSISYQEYMACLDAAEHKFRECKDEIEHLQNIQNVAFKC